MKILFIWEGVRDLPENRAEAIASTMNLFPEAEFLCITKFHSFFSDRFQVISWDDLMEEMRLYFGFKSIPYCWLSYMAFSDWARFYYLGHHGGTLYLDTDTRMLQRFEFGEKVVYPEREICLLYAPGNPENRQNLLRLLKNRAKKRVNLLLDLHSQMKSGWAEMIPSAFYRHR